MNRQPLDIYDDFPREMRAYLQNNGWHFNKKACKWALSHMKAKGPASPHPEPLEPWTKDEVDDLLKRNNVVLQENTGYDYVYVANMAKADYFKSALPEEAHVALFIKDTIDDPDGADGMTMRRWYAGMVARGIPVDWEEIL